ncbi:class I SAM-dependent rRNA methyltransferase [Kyrpidia spormannii]|uniref:Ribosomal RNA large subunit methyltransferase I n=1 Tax=Kyrpidia spormannii TaxID=2055160 RepID=A0A6F9EBA5_9BACL|nr:class I SAM-dependent rRNA methyltransferase [Kyrpidia spormannii]CAB3393832.1 Ribosomal RNA large subunit methyltransferase I [Kyrpidia spormannii]
MGRVVLHKDRKRRLEQGSPWIFRSEVARVEGDPAPGDVVEVVNHQGHFLARGYINPRSQILVRVLTYRVDEPIDASWAARRVDEALAWRERFLAGARSCRLIYGEADFLPGLIVDRFENILVVQVLALGMERLWPWIRQALVDRLAPQGILLRNDVPVREKEGLPLEVRRDYGEVPARVWIEENGLRLVVDVWRGQKTGYFFDQRENRLAIAPLVPGARVLDVFTHTGAFALHALKFGADRVVCVDQSREALDLARENVVANGYAGRAEFVEANAFDELRALVDQARQFDVVILDPPAFAKSRSSLPGAIRGYKEINLRGMKLVRDGGFLVTASCSWHMHRDLFLDTITEAAVDARKILRLVELRGAAKDHPVIHGSEESNYLKFAMFEVRSRG